MLQFKNPSFEDTASKEWIVTNGIGGYASSTINGANTRRYHGLLVASHHPPTQRQVMVHKIEECLYGNEVEAMHVSSNQYPGVIHPQGYQYLEQFNRKPLPSWVIKAGRNKLEKSIFMVHGANTTVLAYSNIGKSTFSMKLTPLFVDRDYHSLFSENDYFDYYYEKQDTQLKIHSHYGAEALYLKYSKGRFKEERYWFKNFEYAKESYRGLDDREDAYALGNIIFSLQPGECMYLIFTLDPSMLEASPETLRKAELNRLAALAPSKETSQFLKDLHITADQFLVQRASTGSYSILAGYHWFTDWGRDTMIAMRGLCIATGKQAISRSILQTFFHYLNEGMLPNRFPDFEDEALEYNTVDATLWLFVSLYEYYQQFKDLDFVNDNLNKLSEIIQWHLKGTRYGIHTTEKGFIYAGEGKLQLTWMDARVGDYVVTPRHGCPVEIQALWFNALEIYQYFVSESGSDQSTQLFQDCRTVSKKLKTNFRKYFLNDEGYLNDVIEPGGTLDTSFRPNQIYVLSLPFSLLTKSDERRVFELVRQYLFTPFGLRTLDDRHPDFKKIYEGDQWHRDTAYHQGTVWPFLLGDYFVALKKIYGNTDRTNVEILDHLNELERHFYEADCIHGISEIFDGGLPKEGRGTIHQAWSVAALLMAFLK